MAVYGICRASSSSSMVPHEGVSSGNRPIAPADEMEAAIRAVAASAVSQLSLVRAAELLSSNLARLLNAPLALLSRDQLSWRFEAQAFPETTTESALTRVQGSVASQDPLSQLQNDSGYAWTAIALGTLGDRDWALLLPGESGTWANRPGFERLVE